MFIYHLSFQYLTTLTQSMILSLRWKIFIPWSVNEDSFYKFILLEFPLSFIIPSKSKINIKDTKKTFRSYVTLTVVQRVVFLWSKISRSIYFQHKYTSPKQYFGIYLKKFTKHFLKQILLKNVGMGDRGGVKGGMDTMFPTGQ